MVIHQQTDKMYFVGSYMQKISMGYKGDLVRSGVMKFVYFDGSFLVAVDEVQYATAFKNPEVSHPGQGDYRH